MSTPTSLAASSIQEPNLDMYHWQRYLYFRPWYADRKILDAGCGDGSGLAYAATFAAEAKGLGIAPDRVSFAADRYPHASFELGDLCRFDYSEADLVLCMDSLQREADPRTLLISLAKCAGSIVLSTPNRLAKFPDSSAKWSTEEFRALVSEVFAGRNVRWLAQESRWPGRVTEETVADALHLIAVVSDLELPVWPRLGLSMPTCNQAGRAREAIFTLGKFYPGALHFAVVANGSSEESLRELRSIQSDIPYAMRIIENSRNLGYGQGANVGLEALWAEEWYDLFGVVNDDVLSAIDCVPQMVAAIQELDAAGHSPGLIGPVSNNVNGRQQTDIGEYESYPEMLLLSEAYHREHHSAATQVLQLRGLFFLVTPDCLSDVGGFDARFGLGNFEDDDLNVRCRLAGYTAWIADGAFLHHAGSSTFRELNLDYEANIERNMSLFFEKWNTSNVPETLLLTEAPHGVSVFLPLTSNAERSDYRITINGEPVDLVYQATEPEFAAWVATVLRDHPRASRIPILEALEPLFSIARRAA